MQFFKKSQCSERTITISKCQFAHYIYTYCSWNVFWRSLSELLLHSNSISTLVCFRHPVRPCPPIQPSIHLAWRIINTMKCFRMYMTVKYFFLSDNFVCNNLSLGLRYCILFFWSFCLYLCKFKSIYAKKFALINETPNFYYSVQ